MTPPCRFAILALAAMLPNLLAGCSITPPAGTPIPPDAAAQGITPVRALPAEWPGTSSALFFGVHVPRKDQLHTFEKR